MTAKLTKFWMVYGVGQRAPAICHHSEHIAISEAQRLARNNPGIEFYVLQSTHRAVKSDVVLERIEEDEAPPF